MSHLRSSFICLAVFFLFDTISSLDAQSPTIPITTPVDGKFSFTGKLVNALGTEYSQLFTADTASGSIQLQDENQNEIFSVAGDNTGTRLVYRSGVTPTILDTSTGVKIPLALPVGYHPVDWFPDNSSILFRRNNLEVQPEEYTLEVFNVASSSVMPLLSYEVGGIPDITMPQTVPSGVSYLTFELIRQAQWNSAYPEWVFVQLDTVGNPYPENHPIITLNFLYNTQTGQFISVDTVVNSPVQPFSVGWSPDGKYLFFHTGNTTTSINIASFDNVGDIWELNLVDQAPIEGSIWDWLGAGDLMLTSRRDDVNDDTIYSILQLIDGTWHSAEFFRIPRSSFVTDNPADWHITASEAEKQALTCLFDQALVTRLETGMRARVNFTDGTPLRLREDALVYSDEILQMPEGTAFDVIDGSVCANGYRWWQVELDDSTTGWTAEADSEVYFIEPLSTQAFPRN